MRALVIGGGGFLGSRIVNLLHQRGDEVVAFGRRDYPQLKRPGVTTIRGDVRDARAVEAGCSGVDVVFHTAARTDLWGPRRQFRGINVVGTRNVIDACRRAGVGRLVYTSTPSVVFGRSELCHVDESQPYPRRYLAHYPASKAAAERMVLAADGADLATVALRPHLIWGPGDPHLIPRVIQRAREGRLVQVGDGTNRVDITYIDNAAAAHVLAADALAPGSACAGRAYFISQGDPVCLWPWLNEILRRLGIRPVCRSISLRRAYFLGTVIETAYRAVGINSEPRMTRFLALQLAKSHYFDITAAKRDFGYVPRVSTSEGVERLISWLKTSKSGQWERRASDQSGVAPAGG